jgi:hypothetical protein
MDASPNLPIPPGELIIQNGRLSGTRKALGSALTLLGSADGCDLRLDVEGVLPVHCAIVCGPAGFAVRTWHGAVTLLNGKPVAEGPIHDDDLLAVGPFEFRVSLASPTEPSDRAALEREKDALRIQAAAVAAQQAALTDEETRLQQRRVALELQEAQLSAHLEARRQKLIELQTQVGKARLALRSERMEQDKGIAKATAELLRTRGEIKTGREKLRLDRERLAELHRRLKRRHADRWQSTEVALQKRQEQLDAGQRKLDADRATLNELRLRFNGEAELGRRQLQDGWEALRRAQEQWEERRGHQDAELRRRDRELRAAERGLAEQWQQWEETRRGLEAEAEGLETRVRNLRRKALDQEQEAHRRGGAPAALPVPVAVARAQREPSVAEREQLAALEALAAELTDQRLHLLEQAERLIRAREEWRSETAATLADLEEAGRRLEERERQLEPRDRHLAAAEAELRRRGGTAAQFQAQLDGWQARLTAREAAWEADREAVLAESRQREEAAGRQSEALSDLRLRWGQRRQKEVAALRTRLQRCAAVRRQYAALWEECVKHGSALEQQQRALAERALALEQYRLEVIGRAPDSAAADKRLERLRRRCAAPTAAARRNLDRERQALEAEARRLQTRAQQLDEQAAGLAGREAELSRGLAEWESGQLGAQAERARLQTEVQSLTAQRTRHEREAQALRAEVERLARLLIDDGPTLLPVGQAA